MARRSILSPIREEQAAKPAPEVKPMPEPRSRPVSTVKPSRQDKIHVGGYYNPHDTSIIAFQKLGIDLRKTQQEMLFEAMRDYVAKHEASKAFSN
jgi:hypothetical protein